MMKIQIMSIKYLRIVVIVLLLLSVVQWDREVLARGERAAFARVATPTKTKIQTKTKTRTKTRTPTRQPHTRTLTRTSTRTTTKTMMTRSRTSTSTKTKTPSLRPTSTYTATPPSIRNGGFEASTDWLPTLDGLRVTGDTGVLPAAGSAALRLTSCKAVRQSVVVPAGAAFLEFSYLYRLGLFNMCTATDLPWAPVSSQFTIAVYDGLLPNLPEQIHTTEYDAGTDGVWQTRTLDMRGYSGRSIVIEIHLMDSAYEAYLDEIRFVSAALPATVTPLPRTAIPTNGPGCPTCYVVTPTPSR